MVYTLQQMRDWLKKDASLQDATNEMLDKWLNEAALGVSRCMRNAYTCNNHIHPPSAISTCVNGVTDENN